MQRATRQRAAIEDALRSAGRPMTPAELLRTARRRVPGLGLATVYRALRALTARGVAEVVLVPGASPRYELAQARHHHHFRCRVCDKVFEVPGCPGNLSRFAPRGFQVDAHDLVLLGRCAACA
jgi:Fur family ferric uptake transcriptional regulator